jgi:hypothetical protein
MARVTPPVALPQPYLDRLLAELDTIEQRYHEVLDASAIVDVGLNGRSSDVIFVGFAEWRWAPSDPHGESMRMDLLAKVRDWGPRYRLLFPHPIPTVAERLDGGLGSGGEVAGYRSELLGAGEGCGGSRTPSVVATPLELIVDRPKNASDCVVSIMLDVSV